jgi:hypothetical protein
MAIRYRRLARCAAALALLLQGGATAGQTAAGGPAFGTGAKRLFAPGSRSDGSEPGQSADFRYQQSVTDRFENEPPGASEQELPARRAFRRRANWRAFIPLSAAVYTMGLLDQTATIGHRNWRINEQDSLVKPFTQVPAPVFVVGGVTFETGVNWLAWQVSRSRRWHRIWWLTQVVAVGANAYGYDISMHR